MLAQNSARGVVLGQALVRHADGLQPPAHQIAQHSQTAVLVLAACALDGAQHIIARREYRRSDAQRVQITGKAGGLGFAGRHNAERAAQRLRQRGVDQGRALRRERQIRRKPPGIRAPAPACCILRFW